MPPPRQHRRARYAWGREESRRLLRQREEHKNLSWEKFHELNLFPDRTVTAVQIHYFRLLNGRNKARRGRSRSLAPRTSVRPRRTTAATRQRRAKARQTKYPIVFDNPEDDDYETDHDSSRSETPVAHDSQTRARAAPKPSIGDRSQTIRETMSATVQPTIQPSPDAQIAPSSNRLRRPPRPVPPSTTATPEPTTASMSTTAGLFPQVQPANPDPKSNHIQGSRVWSAINTIPPTPELTPHSASSAQHHRDLSSVAWNTVGESSTPVGLMQTYEKPNEEIPTQPGSGAPPGTAPRPTPARHYLDEANSYLALWTEVVESNHAAYIERLRAENTRIRTELEDRLSSLDGIAAERDRLKEEKQELQTRMEKLKRKTEDDIERITGVCRTMDEFENLRVLDMLGFRTKQ